MKTGIELIAEERTRQIEELGWDSIHDNGHSNGQLANAAAVYAMTPEASEAINVNVDEKIQPKLWPFDKKLYKSVPNDRIRELTKAGAFIAAEIDRLIRLQESKSK